MIKLFFTIFLFFLKISTGAVIDNSIYNLILDDKKYLNYKDNENLEISSSGKYKEESNFRIKISRNSSYIIEHSNSNLILTANPPKLEFVTNFEKEKLNLEWNFIETNDNKYIIQNINECFIYYENNNLQCENINMNDASKFTLLKVYEEVKHTDEDLKLIEKEPIDVVIKYIDLSDPDLIRKGIPQLKKDEDNQELKYCVRSILKNIPWIRKIFIVLPNKKVRYFKDYELINEKIVYVYDKDLLGFDSANSCTFQFNFWRMKYFNVSENIIVMDDDYFIGKPLKKSDFFYVENGKVLPAIIATKYVEETKSHINKDLKSYKKSALQANGKQTYQVFWYTVYNTYKFILQKLNLQSLEIPYFTHNAIPCNINDIKEIYDLVYNSEFKTPTLETIYRGIEVLQFQTFYMAYTFNKYHRKVRPISYKFMNVNNAIYENYNYSLYVINTGGDDYSSIVFKKARIAMEKNFPEPTPYEIVDYSYFPSFAFDFIFELDIKNKYLTISNIVSFCICFILTIIIIIVCRKLRKNKKIINKSEENEINLINSEDTTSEEMKYKPEQKGPFQLMDIK